MSVKVTEHRRVSAFGRYTIWSRGNPACGDDDVMILVVCEHDEDEEAMALVSGAGEVADAMWDAWARNRSKPGSWELISRTVSPRSAAEEQARQWLAEHGYEVQR